MKKNKTKVTKFLKDMPFQPKLKVGDLVKHPKDLYDQTESVITEVHRKYQAVNADGSFDPGGLCTLEDTIDSCCLPFSFDGEVLKVWYPREDYGTWIQKAYISESRFVGYSYSTTNDKMNTLWPERSLKLLKKELAV